MNYNINSRANAVLLPRAHSRTHTHTPDNDATPPRIFIGYPPTPSASHGVLFRRTARPPKGF